MTTVAGGGAIRLADARDLPAVRELVRAAGLPLDGLDDAAVGLVATEQGEVVGTAALERHEDASYLLRSVAVNDSVRRRGIAAALLRAALTRADAPVALLTETAADYFAARGFLAVDRAQLPPALSASAELRGACPVSATAMIQATSA